MIVTRANAWMLTAKVAPVLRFMQDQPMVHAADLAYAASFATRVASSIDVTGLSEKQIAAIEKIIARRRWIEPSRWRAWGDVVTYQGGEIYRITACLGADDDDHIKALIVARPVTKWQIWIGPLYEYTRDVDDPRIDPTPAEKRRGKRAKYVTVCRRLVEEASRRGCIIE